jgi:leucyl aminopeptidase
MALKLEFAPLSTPLKGVLIVFCDEGLKFGSATRQVLAETGDLVTRAAAAERFKGKRAAILDIVAPTGLEVSRLVVVGLGKVRELKARDFVKLGGVAMGKVPKSAQEATIIADLPGGAVKPDSLAELALGMRLRAYSFDRYKTKRKDGEEKPAETEVTIAVANVAPVQETWRRRRGA